MFMDDERTAVSLHVSETSEEHVSNFQTSLQDMMHDI
jgi:hypothetical protein